MQIKYCFFFCFFYIHPLNNLSTCHPSSAPQNTQYKLIAAWTTRRTPPCWPEFGSCVHRREHSVLSVQKRGLSACIYKGSVLASSGRNILSIESENEREERRERRGSDDFIMSRIEMMPHWGLLGSLYIQ